MFSYQYEMPAVTVDALILRSKPAEIGEWKTEILLIQRKNDPYKDCWAFPGGFVNKFEEPSVACAREVQEETGILLPHEPVLFFAAGKEGRDPRGWVIALAYWINVPWETQAAPNDDAKAIRWFDTQALPPMAFDHRQTVERYWSIRPYLCRVEGMGA